MSGGTTLPTGVQHHAAQVEQALLATMAAARGRTLALAADLAPVLDELEAFLVGGKRLRAVLLLLGHELAGGDPADVLGPAVACELLQACALVHDDFIDDAPTRRGRPAVHEAFAARHREAGWQGDADHYGASIAVLVGDLAFALGDAAFLEATVAPERLIDGLRLYTVLREEVMAGQTLDVDAAASRSVDPEVALTVARLKSGRYSVTRPLQTGAVLAGASAELVDGLGAVGEPLGLAFQLRDDLLGVFGSESATGKPASGDLLEGKRTHLVAVAAERLDEQGRDRLLSRLGAADLDESGADELRSLLRSSGAVDVVQARIDAEVASARAALTRLEGRVDDGALDTLRALTGWFTSRRA